MDDVRHGRDVEYGAALRVMLHARAAGLEKGQLRGIDGERRGIAREGYADRDVVTGMARQGGERNAERADLGGIAQRGGADGDAIAVTSS